MPLKILRLYSYPRQTSHILAGALPCQKPLPSCKPGSPLSLCPEGGLGEVSRQLMLHQAEPELEEVDRGSGS